MKLNINDKDLIICPNNIKKEILINTNKLVDVKYMDINEFTNNYFGTYKKEAIYFLHKTYNLDIDVVKEYLNNSFLGYPFLEEYYNILKDNNLLIFNPLFKEELKNRNIKVIGYYYLEPYIKKVLEELNANIIIEETTNNKPDIFEFNSEDEEVNYIINDIIEKKLDLNKVFIVNATPSQKILLNRLSKFYKIPINVYSKKEIYSTNSVKLFIQTLKETNNLEDALNTILNIDIKKKVIRLINEFNIKDIDNYYINYLNNRLKDATIKLPIYKNGINLINYDEIINKDNYYYFLSFNEGIAPITILDDELIKDVDRPKLNLLTSLEKIKLEKEKLTKIISNNSNMIITYHLKNNQETFLPSPLIHELDLKVIKKEFNISNFSNLYNKLECSKYLDNYIKYNEDNLLLPHLMSTYKDLNYLSYDNKFKGIDKNILKEYLNNQVKLSYSTMDNYYHCAFRFYIQNILKLDPFKDTFNTFIGNLYHFCLSHMYDKDFDLKKLYNDYLVDKELTNKEKYYVDKLYSNLEFIIDTIKTQDRHSKFNSVLTEQRIVLDKSQNLNITFLGFIDKVKYLEKDNKMYVAIIDYKTGELKIDMDNINYGLHLQLPVYIYLTKKGLKKDIKITGFYLQKILNNKGMDSNDIDEQKKLKLEGYTINDEEIINLFDDTYQDSDVIKGMKLTNNGFAKYTKLISEEEINKVINLVDKLINNTINNIEEGNFPINPKRINNELIGCSYCKYKDLCYLKEEDIINLDNKTFEEIMED